MARMFQSLLVFTGRVAHGVRVAGFWSLIYGYCLLCSLVALFKLWWSLVLRPTTTLQWHVRDCPPACLCDTSLGTHCYVRIKVRQQNVTRCRLQRGRLRFLCVGVFVFVCLCFNTYDHIVFVTKKYFEEFHVSVFATSFYSRQIKQRLFGWT